MELNFSSCLVPIVESKVINTDFIRFAAGLIVYKFSCLGKAVVESPIFFISFYKKNLQYFILPNIDRYSINHI